MFKLIFKTYFPLVCIFALLTNCKSSSNETISKVVFENGPCFGNCPVFYLEIDSSCKAKLFVEAAYTNDDEIYEYKQDTNRLGFFQASISKEEWQKILLQLKIYPWDKKNKTLIVTHTTHRNLLIIKNEMVANYNSSEHEHPILNSPDIFLNIYERTKWKRVKSFPLKRIK